MAILRVKDGDIWREIESIVGPKGDTGDTGSQGPKGESGVYTGTEEPSSDYDVWIIPDGTPGTIPVKLSDLQNDVGFITSSSLPTKTSDLDNDSGFITGDNYYTKSEIDTIVGNIETLLEEI